MSATKGMAAIKALVRRRKEAKVSQAALAKAMGGGFWTTSRISSLENCYLYAKEEYVAQYAAALDSLTAPKVTP